MLLREERMKITEDLEQGDHLVVSVGVIQTHERSTQIGAGKEGLERPCQHRRLTAI